jgi:hypothetical protein
VEHGVDELEFIPQQPRHKEMLFHTLVPAPSDVVSFIRVRQQVQASFRALFDGLHKKAAHSVLDL